MKHKLLLVDDDLLHLESTQEFLQNRGYLVDTALTGDDAIALVKKEPYQYSLVILDYRMHGKDGAATVEALTQLNPDLFVLMFSGDSSRDAVMLATRSGARGFVDKAEGASVFLAEVEKWCRKFEQTHQTLHSPREMSENEKKISSIGLVGRSKALADISDLVDRLKERQGPVLILGESGTGKELIARALHTSERTPFKAVNCASFSSNPQLMASTLFGHAKGSFTGAIADKKGILEEAGEGTVFLDEIYALPVTCQIELLRALQEKVVTPVGSSREIPVKFRLVAAAKPILVEAVKANTFTPDLFYRISRTIIAVPALKDRQEDIEPLVHHFCKKWSAENHENKTFLRRTLPFLENYSWPGNVRELENLIYSLLDLSRTDKIGPDQLDAKFFQTALPGVPSPNRVFNMKQRLDDVEKHHLISVLQVSRTLREAARKMDVSLTTVLRLLKKHMLTPENILGVHAATAPNEGDRA